MSNESNLKVKVKVDSSELDKLSSKLKGINTVGEAGGTSASSGGEPPAAQSAKKVKASVEEMTAAQKYAAEVSKILGEEQNQLATNVDAAEIAQKAFGAALQSFAGISSVAIGATLAIGSATYQLSQQYRTLDASLAANGVTWGQYINSLIQGRDITNAFGIRQTALAGGIRLSGQELGEFSGTIERLKRVVGESAKDIVDRALGGDEGAARQLGIVFTAEMTALQRRQAVIDRMRQLNQQERDAIAEGQRVRAAAFNADSISGPDVGMGGGEAINAGAAGEAAAQRMREAQEAANRSLTESTQIAWAGRQEIVDRGVMAYQNSMNAIQLADQQRLENFLSGNGSIEVSDQELNNRRIGWLQTLNSVRVTSDMTQAQRDAANQTRQQVANQALAAENELRNRNNTVQGVRNRLYQEALRRGIAAGMDTTRLERISISNSQIRVQLEAKIAELRARLATASSGEAEKTRREIGLLLNEIRGVSGGGGSSPLIALSEIRNMIIAVGKASIEASQTDFVRGIREGTISIDEQTRRLNLLRQARELMESRNRQALLDSQSLAEQLEAATNARERQRLARALRTSNENLQRTQDDLRASVGAYDAAGQAIARATSEREQKELSSRLEAEKQAYDSRARNLQNATRTTQDELGMSRALFDAWIATQQGSASDYQRSIADMFSPENMVDNIQAGVARAGEAVAQEQARLAEMTSGPGYSQDQIESQQQRVADAMRNQAIATRDAASAQADLNERMREASFGGQFARAMTNNAKGLAGMGEYAGGLAAKGLNTFADAIWTSLEAIKSGEDVGAALSKMLSATLQTIGQEATVQALMETAAGFAALATPVTAPMAAGHFAAAGMYAGVAIAAGVGYMALPTPPGKAEKEKESTSADRDLLNAQRREQNIIINGSAMMTKEELSKAARKIADYGKDL